MKKSVFFIAVLTFICAAFFSCNTRDNADDYYGDVQKKYGPMKKITMTGLMDNEKAKLLKEKIEAFPDNYVEVDVSKCTYEPDRYGNTGSCLSIAFQGQENLRKVKLGNNVNLICYGLFADCKNLVQAKLPESAVYIGPKAFFNCSSIKKLVLPKYVEVTEIDTSTFAYCDALEELVLPENITRLYDDSSALQSTLINLKTLSVKNYPFSICNSIGKQNRFCFAEPDNEAYQHFDVITPAGKKSYAEFYSECSLLEAKPVELNDIHASSTLKDQYKAENLTDNTWKSWSEGEDGDGCGVYIEADFSEPTCVEEICIKNGYGDLGYYFDNNRVKKMKITLDDDEENAREVYLPDSPDFFYINFNDFTKLYSKIRFTIEEVYPGTGNDNDTCLDEISVNGFSSGDYEKDRTTISMFTQIYSRYEEMDINDDGKIVLLDSYDNDEWWTSPSFRWSDKFYKGSDPGTGGGSSYERYAIYLMKDGRHILVKYTQTSYGIFQEYYPANPEIFVWQNKKWCSVTAYGSEKNLGEAGELLDFVVKNDIDFKFSADEDGIVIRPMVNYQNFICEFKYDDYELQPYVRTPHNQAALGTVESLTAIDGWKNISGSYHETENLLILSSGFNRNPEMTKFLIEQGYEVNITENENENGEKFYSPLEVCMALFDDESVKKVLVDNGAEIHGTESR